MRISIFAVVAFGIAVAGCAPTLQYEPFTVQEMENTQSLRIRFENLPPEELVYEVMWLCSDLM